MNINCKKASTTELHEKFLFFIFPQVYDLKFDLMFWTNKVSFTESFIFRHCDTRLTPTRTYLQLILVNIFKGCIFMVWLHKGFYIKFFLQKYESRSRYFPTITFTEKTVCFINCNDVILLLQISKFMSSLLNKKHLLWLFSRSEMKLRTASTRSSFSRKQGFVSYLEVASDNCPELIISGLTPFFDGKYQIKCFVNPTHRTPYVLDIYGKFLSQSKFSFMCNRCLGTGVLQNINQIYACITHLSQEPHFLPCNRKQPHHIHATHEHTSRDRLCVFLHEAHSTLPHNTVTNTCVA